MQEAGQSLEVIEDEKRHKHKSKKHHKEKKK
jgi:hypothetical protein